MICAAMLAMLCATSIRAQNTDELNTDEDKSKMYIWRQGYVTAGLESNSIYYINDSQTGAERPEGNFGSNNYLKVDFGLGLLEGGLQMEGYFPQLQGYPFQLKGFNLSNKYVRFRDKGFSATLGDFYEQLGSGLLLRAYEERSLGLNNAIEGLHLAYNWSNKLSAKAFVGFPRKFKEYNYNSRIIGADLSLNLMSLAGCDLFGLNVEGSFLSKYQALESEWMQDVGMSPTVNGYSARLGVDWNGLTLKGEWMSRAADVCSYNNFNTTKANAILVEGAYSWGGLGINATFRKICNLDFQSDHNEMTMFTSMNYIPALTQQHTYALASLYPYVSQSAGEIGGQADVYYFFARRTPMGGAKGMRVHGNFSTYYGPKAIAEEGNELYFRDLTIDAERWFGKHFKAIVLYTWQTYNCRVSTHPSADVQKNHTLVLDMTGRINAKHSIRCELQHLWSNREAEWTIPGEKKANEAGNWMAGLLEYTISPGWSINISDMWNYGGDRVHYINGGFSYSRTRVRAALNFGRFREGYQCAGGVCRLIPAYTGANFTLTTSF